jgi:hypothetical protein
MGRSALALIKPGRPPEKGLDGPLRHLSNGQRIVIFRIAAMADGRDTWVVVEPGAPRDRRVRAHGVAMTGFNGPSSGSSRFDSAVAVDSALPNYESLSGL